VADEKPDIHTIRFFALVDSFSHAAMAFLGKIADPTTGKVDRDLDKARVYIDFLATLRAKTEGNLLRVEADHLDQLLSTLRLNYVDECEADRKGGGMPEKGGGEASAGGETRGGDGS
jgi:hypothetical protein